MKKLNRKGFTLIELLANIVILAIIMVVTIPTVLNSMSSAKEGQLQNAANSVAEWFEKQYSLATLGSVSGGAASAYTTFLSSSTMPTTSTSAKPLTIDVLEAAGISDASNNIDVSGTGSSAKSTIYYNTTKGRMCVKLTAKASGQFDNDTDDEKTSSGC